MPSATIVSFPSPAAPGAVPLPTRLAAAAAPTRTLGTGLNPSRREYSLADVARLVGLSHASHRVVIGTLRKLAEQAHMPLPKTPRIHAGKLCTGSAMIGTRSRWDALRFDDWLDDRTPPGGASAPAHAAPPVTAAVREDMAARAATLAQLGRNQRKRA